MSKWLIIAITTVFLLSEIALQINPVWGFLFYVLLLTGLLLGLGFEKEDEYKMILFLMVLPTIRIAGLLIDLPDFWKITLSYYLLTFLAIFYSISFKLDVGFKTKKLIFLPIVIGLGAIIGFAYQKLIGITLDDRMILLISIISFGEELFFRGLIQKGLKEHGVIFAAVGSSVLYGIFSLGLGWQFALFSFILALLSSISYEMTDNLFLSVAMNLGFQMALILLQ